MFREITEMDVASLYPNWDMIIKKQKEIKNMKRDFIVVHSNVEGQVGVIFKDSIIAVLKTAGQGAEIQLAGRTLFVSDAYEEIVKQLFK